MRVRCKTNRGAELEAPYYNPEVGKPLGHVFDLTIGSLYTVYAVGLNGPGTWLYVADDLFVDGPRRYPLSLFEIEDARVSRHWGLASGREDGEQPELLAPASWLAMKWFFNRIVDGDVEAVAAFSRMKADIDDEIVGA